MQTHALTSSSMFRSNLTRIFRCSTSVRSFIVSIRAFSSSSSVSGGGGATEDDAEGLGLGEGTVREYATNALRRL